MSLLTNRNGPAPRQAGFAVLPELKKPWVERFLVFKGRTIPAVRRVLSGADRLGTLKARWGVGRMRYSVLPGLYAAGNPGGSSPVFVTANYKMSFDALRSALEGIDGWVLVLDTKGINVWCAAGKGTFGTDELVRRLASTELARVVTHRKIVLPQLGAVGVSAPEVARRSGFRVEWGPVRASDIPAWLAAGKVKDGAMGRVAFALEDRMAVAPVEIAHSWPFGLAALGVAALVALPANGGWLARALPVAGVLLGAIPIGTALFPALLPFLPTRSFFVKGAILGGAWAILSAAAFGLTPGLALGAFLVDVPLSGFLAMNFTGSSTYTSPGGALLEVEKSFWPMTGSAAAGLAILAAARLLGA